MLALMLATGGMCTPVHAQDRPERVHFLIPGSPGGGWDLTARTVGQALIDSGLIGSARFENLAGGGGGKAIAHLIETSKLDVLMVNSTPIVVRSIQKVFPQSFRDLTPIASVIGDYSVLAVRSQSPIRTLKDLAQRLTSTPTQTTIAGGSVRGSTDHIVAAMLARGLGLPPRSVRYIPYDTGGKAMVGVLSGEVDALSSGYGEVVDLADQGWIRVLCIAAPARLQEAPETPTCVESGARDTVFVNWRGFFAAPDIDARQIAAYESALRELVTSQAWQDTRKRYGWVSLHRDGAAFVDMLQTQEDTLKSLLHELGLLGT